MNNQPKAEPAWAPGYQDPARGLYVYLCERCGQPLAVPRDLCDSTSHVAGDGLGAARAVRSTELARLASAARAALRSPR